MPNVLGFRGISDHPSHWAMHQIKCLHLRLLVYGPIWFVVNVVRVDSSDMKVNKFEQVCSDDHQMSVAGEELGVCPMSGGRSPVLKSEGRGHVFRSDVRGRGQVLRSYVQGVPYHVTYPMMHMMWCCSVIIYPFYLPHLLQVIFPLFMSIYCTSRVSGSTTHSCRTFYYQVETLLILESGDLFCEMRSKQCHFE